MKFITEKPTDYDNLNNLELRSAFEDEENEPMIFTHLKACDKSLTISQYDEDGITFYQSFLYDSKNEYKQDCKILKI